MVASLDPLSLELRAPVAARSLPDDGVLLNMRRALVALGGGDGENADADGHLPRRPRPPTLPSYPLSPRGSFDVKYSFGSA